MNIIFIFVILVNGSDLRIKCNIVIADTVVTYTRFDSDRDICQVPKRRDKAQILRSIDQHRNEESNSTSGSVTQLWGLLMQNCQIYKK